jgi:hypothetical protein
MATRGDWITGTLTAEELAYGEAYGGALNQRARDRGVVQASHYNHTPGQEYQNRIGAQGEVAFCVLTGRRVPTIAEFLATMQGPDVAHYQVRTTTYTGGDLRIYERDLGPKHTYTHYALVIHAAPRFAIVGEIEKHRAWELRRAEARLKNAFVVAPAYLDRYRGPVDASRADPLRIGATMTWEHLPWGDKPPLPWPPEDGGGV